MTSQKKPSISKLKKKLWDVFSVYIKNRDKWTCVTCGRKVEGGHMHAGHYIAKNACGAEYYFGETNVHAQCFLCNYHLEGNRVKYREFIIKKYGMEVLNDIEQNYHRPCHDYPYLEKIAYYKSKI